MPPLMPSLDPFSVPSATTAAENQDTVLAYGACDSSTSRGDHDNENDEFAFRNLKRASATNANGPAAGKGVTSRKSPSLISQLPAIVIASLLNLMMAIPFGVSYFPIGWSSSNSLDGDSQQQEASSDGVSGSFPLPGKEALGIRMCLFSTLVGQIIMTFASRFDNCICFQMIVSITNRCQI